MVMPLVPAPGEAVVEKLHELASLRPVRLDNTVKVHLRNEEKKKQKEQKYQGA